VIRNREITVYVVLSLVLTICGVFIVYRFPQLSVWICLALGILLLSGFLGLTYWRYQKIDQLSRTLKRIATGDYDLDVRDTSEGELNILKSEIYKVTITLREQASNLLNEKEFLAQALSDISHQIKTPLTSMSVMIELIQSENLPAEKRLEFTRSILAQIQRLEWLVSALLRMAQMDAGALQFKPRPTDLNTIVGQALRHLLIPIEVKNQNLEIKIPEQMTINCDPNWTMEALTNVLKNAVEHTPEGGRIQIRAERTPMYDLIEIQDNGAGIPAKDLPHIFDRFYKAGNTSRDSIGIGLAMTKSLLEKQNASITAQSCPGDGCHFLIKFYTQIV